MNEKLPAPCEACRGSGLRHGALCSECRGKGYRLIVNGRQTRFNSKIPSDRNARAQRKTLGIPAEYLADFPASATVSYDSPFWSQTP